MRPSSQAHAPQRRVAALLALFLGSTIWLAMGASASTGDIFRVAGTGQAGFSGDGQAAINARINAPRTVAVGPDGSIYLTDTENNRIRRIDPSGTITTVAGTGKSGSAGDGGPGTLATLKTPHGVAVDANGDVYFADSPNDRVRRIDHLTGHVFAFAGAVGRRGFGGDDGPAVSARLSNPKGVAVGPDGLVYIADTGNNRVRRVDRSGIITTVAGNGNAGGDGDDGPATEAEVTEPRTISLDGNGSLYISEGSEAEVSRIRKVDPRGKITRLAGTGVVGFNGDGPARNTMLNHPRGLAVDTVGNVYIADSENYLIRKVDTSGNLTTIAGTGEPGKDGDGGPAKDAQVSLARGVAVDRNGDLLVADTGNNRIRRIVGAAAPWTAASTPPAAPAPPEEGPPGEEAGSTPTGYWMVGTEGDVYAFGSAAHHGSARGALRPGAAAVDLEPSRSGRGYWIADSAGGVHSFGEAPLVGSVDQLDRGERVTSLSATRSGQGYWVFTNRGRVIPFGDADSFGDMSGKALNGPVLDSIPTASGKGFYMVASDGGIFAFGDAVFRGSMGGQHLNAPVQSLVPASDGGYWLVASDGGVFAFGAPFRGSMGQTHLNLPVPGMVRFGNGYLMVGEDGGIFNFSDRQFHGSLGDSPPAKPIAAVASLDGA
ncbi:MAG: hypothetical protein ACRDV9_10340 [Acidimicrobiia bacterium]